MCRLSAASATGIPRLSRSVWCPKRVGQRRRCPPCHSCSIDIRVHTLAGCGDGLRGLGAGTEPDEPSSTSGASSASHPARTACPVATAVHAERPMGGVLHCASEIDTRRKERRTARPRRRQPGPAGPRGAPPGCRDTALERSCSTIDDQVTSSTFRQGKRASDEGPVMLFVALREIVPGWNGRSFPGQAWHVRCASSFPDGQPEPELLQRDHSRLGVRTARLAEGSRRFPS